MQKLKKYIVVLFLLAGLTSGAQKKETITKYIDEYKDLAVAEMKRTGVPASITLAQGIHESGAGQSKLVLSSNNHFGIKCKSNWTGESVKHDDDARGECFRKYALAEDSYKDHSDFLKNGQRYAFLFSLAPTDYEGWATGLKKAGYATNPKYPQVLIKLVEDYGLQDYTLIALGNMLDNSTDTETSSDNTDASKKSDVKNVFKEEKPFLEAKKVFPIYPEGEFKIHETKVLFVKKGTSFLFIAQQYKIDLSKIFEFNEILPAEVTANDQLIYLQRKRKTGNNEFHTVQPGETLHDIAQQEGIRLESLKELNWLRGDDKPAIGERLSLKAKSTAMPKLSIKENYSLIPVRRN